MILDPWAGSHGIAAALAPAGLRTVTNDISPQRPADYHLDALQPETYSRIARQHGPISAIVTSCWFALLDLALPLAVHAASDIVCAHVPGHYLTNGPEARFSWLSQLRHQGRLHLILGLPRGLMGRRCLWLVVFKDAATRRRLLRPDFDTEQGLTL
jgi:hypothetical protein